MGYLQAQPSKQFWDGCQFWVLLGLQAIPQCWVLTVRALFYMWSLTQRKAVFSFRCLNSFAILKYCKFFTFLLQSSFWFFKTFGFSTVFDCFPDLDGLTF